MNEIETRYSKAITAETVRLLNDGFPFKDVAEVENRIRLSDKWGIGRS